MVLGSMEVHLQMQHGKATGGRKHWGTPPPGVEPHTYNMAFPTAVGLRNCPVNGCRGRAEKWTAIRVHFSHRNIQNTVIIQEEGKPPHPRLPRCEMMAN